MAERGGFEPPIRFNPYIGLANRRLQPLGHLSVNDLHGIIYTLIRHNLPPDTVQKKQADQILSLHVASGVHYAKIRRDGNTVRQL